MFGLFRRKELLIDIAPGHVCVNMSCKSCGTWHCPMCGCSR